MSTTLKYLIILFFLNQIRKTMKILITGATGSVGNSLLPLLAEKGHELIV